MPKHYSLDRKRAAVDAFHAAKRIKREQGDVSINPTALASEVAGGASSTQIYSWLKQDLSTTDRQENRHRPRALSETQEALLVGFACSVRFSHQPLSRELLIRFASNYMGLKISKATISRVMNRHGFSFQKAMGRNSRMVSEKVVHDAIEALQQIRNSGFSPDCIIAMDETGLWSNVTAPRTYHYKNWYRKPYFPFILAFIE